MDLSRLDFLFKWRVQKFRIFILLNKDFQCNKNMDLSVSANIISILNIRIWLEDGIKIENLSEKSITEQFSSFFCGSHLIFESIKMFTQSSRDPNLGHTQ